MGKIPKLSKVIRMDSIPLTKAYYTSEGFLRDKPILTSTGIFEYTNTDGSIRRELRLPEDVFDPKSLKSFRGKPVVISHDAGLVTKDNVHDNAIGTILSDGERSGDDVRAEIIIHDTDEMKECGYKELSLGYNLDLEEVAGEWHGQHYDAIQRNIRINHLALVREARAGEQARLNLDSRDSNTTLIGGRKMRNPKKATRRNDGVLSPDELQKAIEQYKKNRKASQVDEDDVEDEVVEEVEVEDEDDVAEEQPIELPDKKKVKDVEERVKFVKDRRDRRDEEGDPEDTDEAMGIIANQDEDIDYLFDIIDTLLAERDFKASAKDAEEEEQEDKPLEMEEDEIDDLEKLDADEEEEEMLEEDEDDVEELPEEEMEEDEDDVEELPEEIEEDEDDVEELPEEEMEEDEDDIEDEEAMDGCDPDKRMNADSVDALIRERIQLGIIGEKLNLKGLENRSIRSAKKAVIRKVNPNIRLDGKSDSYIDAAYDCAVAKAKKMTRKTKKGISYQKKQMFNKDSRSVSRKTNSADAARQRMINRQLKNH